MSQAEISRLIDNENPWGGVKDAPGISKVYAVKCFDGFCELFYADSDSESLCSVIYDSSNGPKA